MRLRFTIRDLLWLTLVVALAVGWWVDRSRIARDAASTASKLSSADMQVIQLRNDLDALTMQLRHLMLQSQASNQDPEPPLDGMPIMRPRPDVPRMPNSVQRHDAK